MRKSTWPRAAAALLALVAIALLASAAAAQSVAGTPDECARAIESIRQAAPEARADAARSALGRYCRPLPAPILAALQTGKWEDTAPVSRVDRIALLVLATRAAYAEAETLSVSLLENGSWPEGTGIQVEDGTRIIGGLGSVLNRYRVHLLLDIYEQQQAAPVRQAVILALSGSPMPEALLPALDGCLAPPGPVREAALQVLPTPESQDAAVARLLAELSPGPMRSWAERLAAEKAKAAGAGK